MKKLIFDNKINLLFFLFHCFAQQVCKKLINDNEIKIDFNFKNLITPYEVLESPGDRKLGILIKNIKITLV